MFISTIEQIDVKGLLRRIESCGKTGQLLVKQEKQWLEMYFRDGYLMCVGPVQLYGYLGERLCQTGVISSLALQEALRVLGTVQSDEMRMALTLIDLGYVKNEDLRAWAMQSAGIVLQQLLSWSTGHIYFEEDATPSDNRLLVALSLSTLLATLEGSAVSSAQPTNATTATAQGTEKIVKPRFSLHVSNAPTLLEPAQFMANYEPTHTASDTHSAQQSDTIQASGTISAAALLAPATTDTPRQGLSLLDVLSEKGDDQPSKALVKIKRAQRIDTSFMTPDMVLMPANTSASNEQDVQVELTPEQWSVLTLVDENVTLGNACQILNVSPHILCLVVGELLSLGLIAVSYPYSVPTSTEVIRQPVAVPALTQASATNTASSLSFLPGQGLQQLLPRNGNNRPVALAGVYGR